MSRVFGIHSVSALLEEAPERVRLLHVQQGRDDQRLQQLIKQAKAAGIPIESSERRWLDRRVEGSHQGVIAECHERILASETELELHWPNLAENPLILVLDGVTDPRNLGACLRSASAAGVHAVLLPKRRSAPVNDVAAKTAAGAAESLLIVEVTNLARRLSWLQNQGVWLYGAVGPDPAGSEPRESVKPWYDVDLTGPVALVLGAEGSGLRALTAKTCDGLITIPMTGSMSSLNVSVATGIVLFEAVRQRR